jgi:hypothetical protein
VAEADSNFETSGEGSHEYGGIGGRLVDSALMECIIVETRGSCLDLFVCNIAVVCHSMYVD